MFLMYHSEGCNICGGLFGKCYINDLHTTTCSGMLGHRIWASRLIIELMQHNLLIPIVRENFLRLYLIISFKIYDMMLNTIALTLSKTRPSLLSLDDTEHKFIPSEAINGKAKTMATPIIFGVTYTSINTSRTTSNFYIINHLTITKDLP
jgi:hypothetical protein